MTDWQLEPARLDEALARWRAKDPDTRNRGFVNEFLMDLVKDPYGCGREEGDTGVFTGRAGSNIVVVYVPDGERLMIFVADIGFA